MRTLYIHIGFHKTGSSSLQLSLYRDTDRLKELGWDFLSLDELGNSSSFIKLNNNNGSLGYKVAPDFYSKIESSTHDNVIISGEHFSFLNSMDEIVKLKYGVCDLFDCVKIVVYIRRQDKLALSFKQQAAKGSVPGVMASSILCGHSEKALPELNTNIKQYLDYNGKLRLWGGVFGKENLLVRFFEPNLLLNNDICDDFCSTIKLPINIESLRVNEGVNRLFSLYSHLLLDLNVNVGVIDRVRHRRGEDRSKVLPSREEAIKFYSYFKESNSELYKWLGNDHYFDEDFSIYPIESDYKLSSQEMKHLLRELTIASSLDELTANEIDTIRDSAIAVEKINTRMSLKLMLIANKLRPHGKVINSKIKEYQDCINKG